MCVARRAAWMRAPACVQYRFRARTWTAHSDWRAESSVSCGFAARFSLCSLRQRRLHLGKRPVDPLRKQLDVLCLHRCTTPDAQPRRRITIMREIEPGVLLLDKGNELLREVRLRVRRKR